MQVCPNINSPVSRTFLTECDNSVRDLSISKHKNSDIKWMSKHADTTHYVSCSHRTLHGTIKLHKTVVLKLEYFRCCPLPELYQNIKL